VTGVQTCALPISYFAVSDLAAKQYLGTASGSLALEIPPGGARLLSLRRWEPRPFLLGQGWHTLRGGRDYRELAWDEAAMTLSATLKVRAGTREPLLFHLPEGWRGPVEVSAEGCAVTEAEGTWWIEAAETGEATWRARFERQKNLPLDPPSKGD